MARLIEGQAIASTALDRHGEQLSRAELEWLFEQMPAERLMNVNHDPRDPPVARAFNNRLEERPGGVLAIVSDIEVLDETTLAELQGFSISYHRGPEAAPDGHKPPIQISFNPRQVERDALEVALARVSVSDDCYVVVERSDKALMAIAAIIYIISNGFWNEAGADAYRLFKTLTQASLGRDEPVDVLIQSRRTSEQPEIILCPSPSVDIDVLAATDMSELIDAARTLAPGNDIARIVATVDEAGHVDIQMVVDVKGTTIRPAS